MFVLPVATQPLSTRPLPPRTRPAQGLLSPDVDEVLRQLGWTPDAEPTTPDPYALQTITVPTPWGALTLPGPSKAQRAATLEQQAAALTPNPFGAAMAEAEEQQARQDALRQALLQIEPPRVQTTQLDTRQFPRPTLRQEPLPDRPSAAPSRLALGATALAGLLGGWPQALSYTVNAARQEADTHYEDLLRAWQERQRQIAAGYQEAREAREEALELERQRLKDADLAANARAQALYALGLRRAEGDAEASGTAAKLRALTGLSETARDYAQAAADARAARAEVERDDSVRQAEMRDARAGQQQSRMLLGSLLQSRAAERRADIQQQNADTARYNAQQRAAYQQGMLAARRVAHDVRSAHKQAPAGSRTDEVVRAERLRYEALQKAANTAARIWLDARARQGQFGGPTEADVKALEGQKHELAREAARQWTIYQKAAKTRTGGTGSTAPPKGKVVRTGTFNGKRVEVIEE